MANFYNPYSKNPAWGQGFSEMANQLMQMMMMKKYMGDGAGGGSKKAPGPMVGGTGVGGIGQGMGVDSAGLGQMSPQSQGGGMTPEQQRILMSIISQLGLG